MSRNKQFNESHLTVWDLAPRLLALAPKVPAMIKKIKKVVKLRGEDDLSLGTFLENNAEKHPNGRALVYEDESYTHKELNEQVNRLAQYFISRGVHKGDRVIVLMENRPYLIFLIGAIAKIGAVASLINPNLRANALIHSIKVSASGLAVIGEERLGVFEEVRPAIDPRGDLVSFFVRDDNRLSVPKSYVDLTEAVHGAGTGNPPTTADIQLKDPFAYVFTSGTTGLPKAAVLTHVRWVSGGLGFGAVLHMKPTDTMYTTLPLSHSNSLTIGWAAASAYGGTLALRRKFSAGSFWDDTRKYQATVFNYVGELCRYLINRPPDPDDRRNPVKKIVGNGLRPDIWKDFKRRFRISQVCEFYGASETMLSFVNVFNLDNTFGIPLQKSAIVQYDPDTEAPVRDQGGRLRRVRKGEAGLLLGEISARAPYVGYTDEKATEGKVLRDVFETGDAWFNTGDLIKDIGFGHGQFVDRLGDTFRWKGENVSTVEVEEAVNRFHQVLASSVFGVQIPGTDGRAGMAVIMSDAGARDFDFPGLAALVQQALPSYAAPRFIRLRGNLETTTTLKITKTDLKKDGWDVDRVQDPLFVLLPGESEYTPLTLEIHRKIRAGEFRF